MKKVALVFVLAVLVPSLVLAWLAVRSLRDQRFVIERQQSLLYQGVADALAREAQDDLAARQREFALQVESLISNRPPRDIAASFDDCIRTNWPLAQVGFVVNLNGDILSPSPIGRPDARLFCSEYAKFLGNRESLQVYWNANANIANYSPAQSQNLPPTNESQASQQFASLSKQQRSVLPQKQAAAFTQQNDLSQSQYSKVAPSEAEFRQLIGDATQGTVARFVENRLNVLLWYRHPDDPRLVFGAQLSLARLKQSLRQVIQNLDPGLREEIVVALLDDSARPAALSRDGFQADWKHPFVATEIGESLPHWEMAVYLGDPARLGQTAETLRATLGLLIALLLLAIGVGGWLLVTCLNRELTLARQKTDFVSNVSHELKTPLTSIRMFSELLADGRVQEPEKQRSYLNIITAEAARLTRLINNVLDFSRLERGEKKYHLLPCDLADVARETVETFQPHLESQAFKLECTWPAAPLRVNGDRDALAQVIVNLLSNAEKYSGDGKEMLVQVERREEPLPHAEVRICDRGPGVPRGCEEKIFEQFYRAHGGDVTYQPRPGGGSCFSLRLPLLPES